MQRFSNSEEESGDSRNKNCIYEVYTYKKCPKTKLSPWQKISSDRRVLDAQAKAHELFKTELYEKIEIQQKPINSNDFSPKIIKTYRRTPLIHFIKNLLSTISK